MASRVLEVEPPASSQPHLSLPRAPLAPTSPAGQAACSLGAPWPASRFHGELGERAPGVALPISGWWGLLRPPQSSLMGLGLRETLSMEPTEA